MFSRSSLVLSYLTRRHLSAYQNAWTDMNRPSLNEKYTCITYVRLASFVGSVDVQMSV